MTGIDCFTLMVMLHMTFVLIAFYSQLVHGLSIEILKDNLALAITQNTHWSSRVSGIPQEIDNIQLGPLGQGNSEMTVDSPYLKPILAQEFIREMSIDSLSIYI